MNSIIIIAAYSLVELHDLIFLVKVKAWKDITLLIVTFLVTFFLGVDFGIFIGAGISLLLVIKHTTLPHIAILGKDGNKWVDVYQDSQAKIIPEILILRIEESLYFANVEQIKEMLKRIQDFGSHLAHPTDKRGSTQLKAIVIHAKNIAEIDASAIQVLLEMIEDYQKQNIFVCFVKLRASLKNIFVESGIIDSLGGDRLFESNDEAVSYIQKLLKVTSMKTLTLGDPEEEVNPIQIPLEKEKEESTDQSISVSGFPMGQMEVFSDSESDHHAEHGPENITLH